MYVQIHDTEAEGAVDREEENKRDPLSDNDIESLGAPRDEDTSSNNRRHWYAKKLFGLLLIVCVAAFFTVLYSVVISIYSGSSKGAFNGSESCEAISD